MHESGQAAVKYAIGPLHDGPVLDVGNVKVKILHTLGYRPDSIGLLVTEQRRGDAAWFVLSGDILSVGSVARPDLAGREREMADMLYDNLAARPLPLPDNIESFPGHQAGSSCGAGLSGKPSATLGFEIRWNPALSTTREDVIESLIKDIPPRLADMDAMVRANLSEET